MRRSSIEKSIQGCERTLVLDNGHPCFYDIQTTARGTTKFTSRFLGQSQIHVQEVHRWAMHQANMRSRRLPALNAGPYGKPRVSVRIG